MIVEDAKSYEFVPVLLQVLLEVCYRLFRIGYRFLVPSFVGDLIYVSDVYDLFEGLSGCFDELPDWRSEYLAASLASCLCASTFAHQWAGLRDLG